MAYKMDKNKKSEILSRKDACQPYLLMIERPMLFLLHLLTDFVRAQQNLKKLGKMQNFCSCFKCF